MEVTATLVTSRAHIPVKTLAGGKI